MVSIGLLSSSGNIFIASLLKKLISPFISTAIIASSSLSTTKSSAIFDVSIRSNLLSATEISNAAIPYDITVKSNGSATFAASSTKNTDWKIIEIIIQPVHFLVF